MLNIPNKKLKRFNSTQTPSNSHRNTNNYYQKKHYFLLAFFVVFFLGILVFFILKPQSDKKELKILHSNEHTLKQNYDEKTFLIKGEMDPKYKLPIGTLTFAYRNNKVETKQFILDTFSYNIILNSNSMLQSFSKEEYTGFLYNPELTKKHCPSPFEKHFCLSRKYLDAKYTNLVLKINMFDTRRSNKESFEVISELIVTVDNADNSYLIEKGFSVLGIGYLYNGFDYNYFLDSLFKYIENTHKKEIPKVLSMVFEGRKFFVSFGKKIDVNSYFSIEILEDNDSFEVDNIFIGKKKINKEKQPFFVTTGYNINILASNFFDDFIKTLKLEKQVTVQELKLNSFEGFRVEISDNIFLDTMITLELGNIKMIIPLRSFLPFHSNGKRWGNFVIESDQYSHITYYTIQSCFDFFMNGDNNTIGFKLTSVAEKMCSLEYK